MFESGICGQWGFFSSPLIYTVCSETHRGLFRLGVCSGGRPSISALRLGTATTAAPGGPVRHKTSRGLLALRVASFHLGSRPCPASEDPGHPWQPWQLGREAASAVDFTFGMRAFWGLGGEGWAAGPGPMLLWKRLGSPRAWDETCSVRTRSRPGEVSRGRSPWKSAYGPSPWGR